MCAAFPECGPGCRAAAELPSPAQAAHMAGAGSGAAGCRRWPVGRIASPEIFCLVFPFQIPACITQVSPSSTMP